MLNIKSGDWIKLFPKTKSAETRVEFNGPYWVIEDLLGDRMKIRSSQKTFGSRDNKRYDGMVIWLSGDPNYDWTL